ncbi:aryl-alcohol dehydrogenase-like predicted oxidoreductase [Salana multivorans]|uniref:Aryl-alcohol dehydrogenase-like predicted oxidoreductase n=1 Tax=Salana multivorans TaxID=120377 RepID=A0A3N2D0V4_9MICO|nr:aldo/keto reductase [Salana multivorans]ROR93409.1 aryl-alcohol dehydrogenase-like predicted oxidoreductase [Salana multivorans]
MESRRLGASGLHVPPLGLGTLTWGRDTDVHEARDLLTAYLDAGGFLLDTAASYAAGASETTIGRLLGEHVAREEVVLCSKAGVRVDGAPGPGVDAGRGSLLGTLDASLRRLGTDHLDLWLVQVFDPDVPVEETLSALDVAVRSGRVRYVGVSNYPGWAAARTATLAAAGGGAGTGLTAVQMEHSLLQRGAERELLPAAAALGLGTMAWSPLGRGVLTGKYRRARPADSRAASAHLRSFVEPYLTDAASRVVEAVATAAQGLGRSPAQVALAWTRGRVDTSLIGPRTPAQLAELLDSLDLELPEPITQVLDEVTAPALGYPERR